MKSRRTYRRRTSKTPRLLPEKGYVRIIVISLIVVTLASFYIYQRIWVRQLDATNRQLQERNEVARDHLMSLKDAWVSQSTLAAVEESLSRWQLKLRPTLPPQNLTLTPGSSMTTGRYAELVRALEKLKENMPLIGTTEAEANQLFESQ